MFLKNKQELENFPELNWVLSKGCISHELLYFAWFWQQGKTALGNKAGDKETTGQ